MSELQVIAPGPLTLIEDQGRQHPEWGIALSGAADRAALALANRLVGNTIEAAGLECLLGGLTLRALGATVVAVTGADCAVTVDGRRVDSHRALSLSDGQVLQLGSATAGLRAYVAVRGGIDSPAVLGSRSRDVLAALGPAPLAVGDTVPVGAEYAGPAWFDYVAPVRRHSPTTIRIAPGPRLEWISSPDALSSQLWTVRPESDRTGVRLTAVAIDRRPGDLPSEPTLVGAIQVPPDGQPIVLGPDAGVSGGYPVVAVVWDDDLDLLAQVRPGDAVRLLWAS